MKSMKLRVVSMTVLVLSLVFASMGFGFAADTQVVLDFEDLPYFDLFTYQYQGLNWQYGWYAYPGGINYCTHSGARGIVFIGQSLATGPSAWIDFSPLGKDVVFDGAWFGGHSGTGDIWFEGWRDGVLVATSAVLNINSTNAYTSTYLAADFGQLVDKVHVVATSEEKINELIMDDFTYTIPGDISVEIDIMPNDTNTINLKAKGVLPVAIFGSEEFDVYAIDPATVAIGQVGVMVRADKLQIGFEDVNYDGYMDMVCKFNISDLIEMGELTETTTELTISGDLINDGDHFVGTDYVIVLVK